MNKRKKNRKYSGGKLTPSRVIRIWKKTDARIDLLIENGIIPAEILSQGDAAIIDHCILSLQNQMMYNQNKPI